MNPKKALVDRSSAERLAIGALVFLSAEEARFLRYLNLTGLDPQTLRAAAGDENFLASVLDYIMHDEALLVLFSETEGLAPAEIVAAHGLLSQAAGEAG